MMKGTRGMMSAARPMGALRCSESSFPLSSRSLLRWTTNCAASAATRTESRMSRPLSSLISSSPSSSSSSSASLRPSLFFSAATRRPLHTSTTTRQEAATASETDAAAPEATAPAYIVPDSFAIVYVGGRQYKVTKGDLIITERLLADVGEKIHLKKVLLVGSQNFTAIGTPLLTEAVVEATVEEQTRAAKVIVFKFKRRKNHRRTRGHRQSITVLRIGDVKLSYPQAAPEANSERSAMFGPVVPSTRYLPPSADAATEPKETIVS